mgnify:CR=1 FL=1
MKPTVQQAELYLISSPSQREKKSRQLSRFFGEKDEEMGMDARSRWGITQIHQRVQNQMPIQPRWLRSWSVGHVHWSLPGLCCRFFTQFWAWFLPRSWVTTQRYGQQRVEVLQKKLRRGEAKNQTWISTDKGKSKECKTRLLSQLTTAPGAAVIKWCKMYLQFIIWYVGRFLFYDITLFRHPRWRSSATISDHEDKGSDGLSRWILVLCKNQGHSHIKLSSMRPDFLRTLRRINWHCHIPQNSAAINFSWFGGVGWCKLFWPPDDYENFLQNAAGTNFVGTSL